MPKHSVASRSRFTQEEVNEHRVRTMGYQRLNLDEMSPADLFAVEDAPVNSYYTEQHQFAAVKRRARELLAKGNLRRALELEQQCDSLHDKLPLSLQWRKR